ncbi:unnamed protein product [Agarophyton chilense]|eukprot:gb/GEZJ01001821.1/.p1 GENE.gb/GEZJ01001821.1/~~gb/GEZJ01001821.1/.p1  ORF type:complete len:589 (-),score=49.67 gb/GEZJ01001821.1/:918-2597(-)
MNHFDDDSLDPVDHYPLTAFQLQPLQPHLHPLPLLHRNLLPLRSFKTSPSLDSVAAVFQDLSAKLPLTHTLPNLQPKPNPRATPQRLPHTHFVPSYSTTLDFGSKTPYPHPSSLQPLHTHTHPTARLIHVSLIARHGTRNPTNSCIQRITALQTWLHSVLSPIPLWLHQWSAQLHEYRASPGSLTSHGHQELHAIGSRFARLYARALHDVGNTVRLRSSYKERAISSARAFLDGYRHTCSTNRLPQPNTLVVEENTPPATPPPSILSESSEQSEVPEPLSAEFDHDTQSTPNEYSSDASTDEQTLLEILPSGRDKVLRYFEHNAEYAQFALHHKALTLRHLSRGPLLPIATQMAQRISNGLGASQTMDPSLIRPVAEAGAFENAHGRLDHSVFCRVLTPKDTAILELFEKYHRPFFQQLDRFRAVAAPLVADLAQSLRASAACAGDADVHAADLRFAHAETLVPLLILLGIDGNGMIRDSPDYRFGLSAMSPFASNLAFELYEQESGAGRTHFVRLRLHERYVEGIPALKGYERSGMVPLQVLLKFFDGILEEGKHFYE